MTNTRKAIIYALWNHGDYKGRPCRLPFFDGSPEELPERIEHVRNYHGIDSFTPVAWAPEGGERAGERMEALHAAAIAAGRLIKKVDGKYIALGVEQEEQPLFRIGGCYRNRKGTVVELVHSVSASDLGVFAKSFPGHPFAQAVAVADREEQGYISLLNGLFCNKEQHGDVYDLIAGEVDTQGNPINTEKPAPAWVTAARERVQEKRAAEVAATQERKQPPLDWNPKARTPYDPFADFAVSSGCSDQDSYPDSHTGVTHSPDLQPAGHQVAPMFGNAAGLGKCA